MIAAAPAIGLSSLWPEFILAAVACAVLLLGQAGRETVRRWAPAVSLAGIIAAIIVLRLTQGSAADAAEAGIRGGLYFDALAGYVRISALILGVLIVLTSWSQPNDAERGEFFALMLFSIAGLMLVGPSMDLVVLFLALELVSIPTYILVALGRSGPKPVEGATKYFYLGAMAAAMNAFGFSYLYGVMGSSVLDATALDNLVGALNSPGTTAHVIATIGLVMSIAGLLFKLSAVPLHFYVADVYHGAASPVAGMLGFVPKLAGLIAIFRIINMTDWMTSSGALFWLLWIVAALTMTVGNVLALRQTNIKRMLAYSGVAHSGYMLVGLLAGPFAGDSMMGDGCAAVLYYIVIYGIANLGAFALLGLLRVNGRPAETLRDVAGLVRHYPTIALLMALAMFTLMSLPPTPGFWGKLSLFGSALAAADSAGDPYSTWLIVLVIIAVLNSALAAAYYLRVAAAVLLFENDEPAEPAPREAQMMGALLCGFLLLAFAFYPRPLMQIGRDATEVFREPHVSLSQDTPQTPASVPDAIYEESQATAVLADR